MNLKRHVVRKDGKEHVYYSLSETMPIDKNRTVQRRVLNHDQNRFCGDNLSPFAQSWALKINHLCKFNVRNCERWVKPNCAAPDRSRWRQFGMEIIGMEKVWADL